MKPFDCHKIEEYVNDRMSRAEALEFEKIYEKTDKARFEHWKTIRLERQAIRFYQDEQLKLQLPLFDASYFADMDYTEQDIETQTLTNYDIAIENPNKDTKTENPNNNIKWLVLVILVILFALIKLWVEHRNKKPKEALIIIVYASNIHDKLKIVQLELIDRATGERLLNLLNTNSNYFYIQLPSTASQDYRLIASKQGGYISDTLDFKNVVEASVKPLTLRLKPIAIASINVEDRNSKDSDNNLVKKHSYTYLSKRLVAMPELPIIGSYKPTSIKDIRAANPSIILEVNADGYPDLVMSSIHKSMGYPLGSPTKFGYINQLDSTAEELSLVESFDSNLSVKSNSLGGNFSYPLPQIAYMDFMDLDFILEANSTLIKVFPNPNGSIVDIVLNGLQEEVTTVKLVNIFGIEVKKETFNGKSASLQLELEDLPNGIYEIHIAQQGRRDFIKKFVILKQ